MAIENLPNRERIRCAEQIVAVITSRKTLENQAGTVLVGRFARENAEPIQDNGRVAVELERDDWIRRVDAIAERAGAFVPHRSNDELHQLSREHRIRQLSCGGMRPNQCTSAMELIREQASYGMAAGGSHDVRDAVTGCGRGRDHRI